MRSEGINRVIIVVKDIDKATKFYSELLGVSFQDASGTNPEFGVRSMVSWDGGIEICSPADTQAEVAKELATYLKNRGEGVLAVVFNVKDIDEATSIAMKKGVNIIRRTDYREGKVKGFKQITEVHLNPADCHGVYVDLFKGEPM